MSDFLSRQMYFLIRVPEKSHVNLLKWNGTRMELKNNLSLPQKMPYAASEEWLACLTKKGRGLAVVNLRESPLKVKSVELPFKNAICVSIFGDLCVVGGYGALWILNLKTNTEEFLEIPDHILRRRKSIDHLLVEEDRMIAVDNVIRPKWLLVYERNSGNPPRLAAHPKLPTNGTYEHYSDVALGKDWMALLSTCMGHWGGAQYITVLRKTDFKKYVAFQEILHLNPDLQVTGQMIKEEIKLERKRNPENPRSPSEIKMDLINRKREKHENMPEKPLWKKIGFLGNILWVHRADGLIGRLDIDSYNPDSSPAEKKKNIPVLHQLNLGSSQPDSFMEDQTFPNSIFNDSPEDQGWDDLIAMGNGKCLLGHRIGEDFMYWHGFNAV